MSFPSPRLAVRLLSLLILAMALVFLVQGARLLLLGGSVYYVIAGLLMAASGAFLWRYRALGSWLYALMLGLSLFWALWEGGLSFWPLVPRLAVLTLVGLLLLLPPIRRALESDNDSRLWGEPLTWSLSATLLVTLVAYVSYIQGLTIEPAAEQRQTVNNASDHTDWPAYGNSRKGTRYSPLDQITPKNVAQLEVAWSIRTGVGTTFKDTPIQVEDTLYVCAGGNVIIALDAETGTEQWRYDAGISEDVLRRGTYFSSSCRGVSYYQAPSGYSGECPTRILMGTTDARLLAVDAETGEACRTFGDKGAVDLTHKLGEVKPRFYFVTSAPAIVRGNAVVGGWVRDNYEIKEPSGAIRAFDAITGEFAWAWDMGRPGVHTQPGDGEIYTRGTPNVWSLFSVDEERGMVFAPTGNETPDYFGAGRHEASEEYASSVVALNGETGELVWSFQTVHHDIWDYDVPSQPTLVDVPNGTGELVPAVVQATKRGEVFMLNRETGEPIAPVEERPVPQGGVPEDWTAATQPYSTLPNPLRTDLTEADMWGITPFDQLSCRIAFKKMRYEGHFTPPSTRPTLQYPGNAGGYNWGSVSVHEGRHIMVGNLMNLSNRTRLVPRKEMETGVRASPQLGTPYGAQTRTFTSPLDIPCNEPPFGILVAIDLQKQRLLWQRPIGTANDLGPWGIKTRIPIQVGTPNSGGTIVTESGLIFFAGTMDRRFRAVDLHSGQELWNFKLPESAQASPMTYLSPDSQRQTVIITLPVHGRDYGGRRTQPLDEEDPEGGYIMAFRLPAEE